MKTISTRILAFLLALTMLLPTTAMAETTEEPADAPAQNEAVQEETQQDDPVVDDSQQDDPVEDEPKQDDPVEDESKQDDPVEDEPKQDNPVEDEPKQDDPVVEDPKQDAPVEDEPKQDDPVEDEPKQDDPVEDEAKQDKQTPIVPETISGTYVPDEGILDMTNDELLQGYFDQELRKEFFGDEAGWFAGGVNEDMDAATTTVYTAAEALITAIAAGEEDTATLTVENIVMSESELKAALGLSKVFEGSGVLTDEAYAKLVDAIDINKIIYSLLQNYPYEMYWYDKTWGIRFEMYDIYVEKAAIKFTYSIKFTVANGYNDGVLTEDGYLTVDTTKTKATSKAVKQAAFIVNDTAHMPDRPKLEIYKNWICDLTDYNDDALDPNYPYGDPWQLIYVFDGDPNTKVVCEGYSKAFKYLCDLSTFRGDVTCYTVTGRMNGGGHMWNVVEYDGGCYLVDVTNCDDGMAGYPDKLFLKTASKDSNGNYRFTTNFTMVEYSYYNDSYAPDLKPAVAQVIKLPTPTGVEISLNADGKPVITWDDIPEAPWFNVLRSSSADGVYSGVGSIFDGSCRFVDDSAENGTTYYYKVCAVGDGITYNDSENSTAVSTAGGMPEKLAAPILKITTVASNGKPKLTWNAVAGAAKYEIYRATSKNGTYYHYNTVTTTSYTNYDTTPGKLYYYKVRAIAGTMSSDFSAVKYIACDCAQPVVKISTVASTGKPKLTWDAVAGATKYEIYRYNSSAKEYRLWDSTTSTSFVNSGSTTPGTIYYYKVKAICGANSGGNSSLSNKVYIACDCAQPVVKISTVASTGKPKLTWNAVAGATKYYVYRYNKATDKYEYWDSTTSTSMVNSTNTTPGTIYYYKVQAICGANSGGNSSLSNKAYIACDCAQPVVKISTVASTGKPKLTWNAVTGATKYEIYRYNSSAKEYRLWDSTTSTSFVNSSSTIPGTIYYYKVKAICGSNSGGNSALSASKGIACDCARPVVSITTNASGKPKLSWNKVAGATKYEIYRYDSTRGEYRLWDSTTYTTFTNSNVTPGQTYRYKVRAICGANSGGNSAYSAVVSIKAGHTQPQYAALEISDFTYYYSEGGDLSSMEGAVGTINATATVRGPSNVCDAFIVAIFHDNYCPNEEDVQVTLADIEATWDEYTLPSQAKPFQMRTGYPVVAERLGTTDHVIIVGIDTNNRIVAYAVEEVKVPA